MAKINVTSGTASAYGQGELQLQNKAPMDSTLRPVTDSANTASPLNLSTSLVQTTSTLKITTNDNPYIDAEDGAGNNRFTVGRDTGSQQVNVDFASNPGGSTTIVGAIRTYVDGVNLSEVMAFREDGNIGINTLTPGAKLDIHSASNVIMQLNRTGAGKSWLQYLQAGTARWNTGYDNTNGNFTIYDAVAAADRMVVTNAGNVGIGTTAPYGKFDVRGGAISRTTTDFVPLTTGSVISLSLGASTGNTFGSIVVGNTGDSIAGNLVLAQFGGNVGIGTTAPESKLHVADGVAGGTVSIFVDNNLNALNSTAQIKFTVDAGGTLTSGGAAIQAVNTDPNYANTDLVFRTSHISSGSLAEIFRLTDGARYLRMAAGTGGIQFNGDTAAANALDDYEEGTWTMGVSFGGGTTGITYANNVGTFTKIGRQVTVNGLITLSSKGSSTGVARVTGLPFTIGNSVSNYAAASLWLQDITFVGQFEALGIIGTTYIDLAQLTEIGVFTQLTDANFLSPVQIAVNYSYFV